MGLFSDKEISILSAFSVNKSDYLQIRKNMNFTPSGRRLVEACVIIFTLGLGVIFFGRDGASFELSILSAGLHSIVMFGNFSLLHVAAHVALSPNIQLTDILGVMRGVFCMLR